MAKSSRRLKVQKQSPAAQHSRKGTNIRNSRTTVSGAAEPDASGERRCRGGEGGGNAEGGAAVAFNANKAAEYDPKAALAPPQGASVKPDDPIAGASTVSELNGSEKAGSGGPNLGQNPTVGPLDRVRVDSTARALTTNRARWFQDGNSRR